MDNVEFSAFFHALFYCSTATIIAGNQNSNVRSMMGWFLSLDENNAEFCAFLGALFYCSIAVML